MRPNRNPASGNGGEEVQARGHLHPLLNKLSHYELFWGGEESCSCMLEEGMTRVGEKK